MKKLTVGVAAALSFMASNAAADGPYRRPTPTIAAPVAAPPTWTGFYLGAGIGAGAVVNDVTVHDRVFDERMFDFSGGDDGVLGTVIVGWDWQLGPNSVLGVFADYDFLDRSSRSQGIRRLLHHSHDHNNVWSVGARLGWLSSPSVLWYVTAGYTQVDVDHSARFFDLDGLNISRDRTLDGYLRRRRSGYASGGKQLVPPARVPVLGFRHWKSPRHG